MKEVRVSTRYGNVFVLGLVAGLVVVLVVAGIFIAINGWSLLFGVSNSWNGIEPGKTSKEDVVRKMGSPIEDISMPFSRGLVYDSGIEAFPNIVIYDDSNRLVEGILVSITDEEQAKNLYSQAQRLGKAERLMFSRYLMHSEVWIFASKGLTYTINKDLGVVEAVHYYTPMKLEGYLSKYSKFFAVENKFEL